MTGAPVIVVWRTNRRWYWHRVAGGNVTATGHQGFRTKWGAQRAAKKAFPGVRVKSQLPMGNVT